MRVIVDKNTSEVLYASAPQRRMESGEWVMGVITEVQAFDEAVTNGLADERENWLSWVPPELDTAQAFAGVAREDLASRFEATISDGQVVNIESVPQPTIYLHLSFSGGDGEDPPGIQNDGVDGLNITVSLRSGPDPADALIPLGGGWRVTIRDDTGAIYDVVKITLSGGQANVTYTSSARPAVCALRESDLVPVEVGGVTYRIRLAGDAAFKIYRVL